MMAQTFNVIVQEAVRQIWGWLHLQWHQPDLHSDLPKLYSITFYLDIYNLIVTDIFVKMTITSKTTITDSGKYILKKSQGTIQI